MTKLVIFGKDGTLVRPNSGGKFVQYPEDQVLLPSVKERVDKLHKQRVKIAIATNQGGVKARYKSLDDAIKELGHCLSLLNIPVGAFCPDDGSTVELVRFGDQRVQHVRRWKAFFEENFSDFRKPGAGMIQVLQNYCFDNGVDDWMSVPTLFIGDRSEDEQAAANAGVQFMCADEWREYGI